MLSEICVGSSLSPIRMFFFREWRLKPLIPLIITK